MHNLSGSLYEHLFVSVRLQTNLLDPSAERGYLPTGDLYTVVFARTQTGQVTARYLDQALRYLQGSITRRYTWERLRYVSFLKQACGPAATPPQSTVVRADATLAMTRLGARIDQV